MTYEVDMNDEIDYKEICKKFLPALIALLVALIGWISNDMGLDQSEKEALIRETELTARINNLELRSAEFKGELKAQRGILTELQLDIREIKTILENNLNKRRH